MLGLRALQSILRPFRRGSRRPSAGAGVSAAFWRLVIRGSNAPNECQLAEIQFRPVAGVAAQETGGSPVASYTGVSPSFAFDGQNNYWTPQIFTNPVGAWIGYQKAAPAAVAEVMVQCGAVGTEPTALDLEYSSDGVSWTLRKALTPAAWAGANTQQTFAVP